MTILVTGATGFVGAAIVRALAYRRRAVRAAARNPALVERLPGVEAVALPDLAGSPDWQPLLSNVTAVVHAAGLAHQPPTISLSTLMRVNAEASGTLANAAAAAGVSRFILMSSIRAVTGASATHLVQPTDEPAPTDDYGRSKLAAEFAVCRAFPGAIVLRPPVVHGAGAKGNMARLARLALSPLPLPIGGLTGRRSLVSEFNLASAVVHLLDLADVPCPLIHVQDGPPLTVPDMIRAMRQAFGRWPMVMTPPAGIDAAAIRMLAPGLASQLVDDLVISDDGLRATGWQPIEPSSDGLARMARTALFGQTRL